MPSGNFKFKVEIDGLTVGGFSEVSGLSASMRTFEYNEGGVNAYPHYFIESYQHENIVLKKGMLDSSLMEWYKNVKLGQIELKSGTIILFDKADEELVRWNFNGAYPIKFSSANYSGLSSEIAIETIELVHTNVVMSGNEATSTKPAGADKAGSASGSNKKDKDKEQKEKESSSMFGLLDALEDVVDDAFDAVGLDYELTKGKLIDETFANLDTSKITDNFAAVALKGIVNGDSPSKILEDTGKALVENIEDEIKDQLEPFEDAAKAGIKAYNEGQSLDQVCGEMAGAYTETRMENLGFPPYACRVGAAGAKAGAISLANGDSPSEAKASAYGAMTGASLKEMGMDEEQADQIGNLTTEAIKAKNQYKDYKKSNKKNPPGGKKKDNDKGGPDISKYSKEDVDKVVDKFNDVKSVFGL